MAEAVITTVLCPPSLHVPRHELDGVFRVHVYAASKTPVSVHTSVLAERSDPVSFLPFAKVARSEHWRGAGLCVLKKAVAVEEWPSYAIVPVKIYSY
tara:strand:- start:533 stop:823 length:291 start_codon:yes stop_codon:yes gene_type:complete